MTIRAGGPWGDTGPVPADVRRVSGDAEVGALVAVGRRDGTALTPVAPVAGDLFRALGGSAGVDRLAAGGDVARLPCDVLRVTLDGDRVWWAVAHVVVRRRLFGSAAAGWWRGRIIAMMNVQFLGEWDVAPRAHPNDGRVDVVEVPTALGWRERLEARRRLPLGAHLPHPEISTRQVRAAGFDLGRGERVWIDGVDRGPCRRLEIAVEPDALVVCV